MATQILILSPAGGCVVTAVTRQTPGLLGSTAADSIVVFGNATVARLSQDRTGFALAIAGFGLTAAGAAPPRPAPAGARRSAATALSLSISHRRLQTARRQTMFDSLRSSIPVKVALS